MGSSRSRHHTCTLDFVLKVFKVLQQVVACSRKQITMTCHDPDGVNGCGVFHVLNSAIVNTITYHPLIFLADEAARCLAEAFEIGG